MKFTIIFLVLFSLALWSLSSRLFPDEIVRDGEPLEMPATSTPQATFPTDPRPPVIDGPLVTIAGAGGKTLNVRPFLSLLQLAAARETGAVAMVEAAGYEISYATQDSFFSIMVRAEPVVIERERAVAYLAQALGISAAQVCELNVSVGVPYWVNERYAGQELGVPGCPGAINF